MVIRRCKRARKVVMATLYCSKCHNKAEIWRKAWKQKKNNHIKHLWCIKCRYRTAHIEWNDYFEPEVCVSKK